MKISPLVIMAISLIATSTVNGESWRCTYSPTESRPSSYVGFEVKNDLLLDDLYGTQYSLLENNQNALLAETHYAGYDPVLMTITLFIETVMIDKTSRHLTVTTAVSGSEAREAVGSCQTKAATEAEGPVANQIMPR